MSVKQTHIGGNLVLWLIWGRSIQICYHVTSFPTNYVTISIWIWYIDCSCNYETVLLKLKCLHLFCFLDLSQQKCVANIIFKRFMSFVFSMPYHFKRMLYCIIHLRIMISQSMAYLICLSIVRAPISGPILVCLIPKWLVFPSIWIIN